MSNSKKYTVSVYHNGNGKPNGSRVNTYPPFLCNSFCMAIAKGENLALMDASVGVITKIEAVREVSEFITSN